MIYDLRFTIYAVALWLLAIGGASAQEQAVNTTAYTRDYLRATNAPHARMKLGIYETNAAAYNVTNVFTNFNITSAVIGVGADAVTLTPASGTMSVGPAGVNWEVPAVTAGEITNAGGITLGGVRLTAWPSGSANGIVTNGQATVFYISFQTNYSPVAASALTNIGYFTNGFARADWTATNGSVLTMEYSTDNTNWTAAAAYNAPAWLRLSVVLAALNPGTEAVTNFTVWSVQNLGTLGYTNDYTLQTLLVASPTTGSAAASKDYADFTALTNAQNWSASPARADVRLANNPLRPDSLWRMARSVSSNEVRLAWSFGGNELLSISPGFTGISNGVSLTATGAVAYIAVATNNAPGPFRVLCSSNNWQWFDEITVTNGYPTASGTNYLVTFPAPTGPGSWIYQVGRSNAPALWFNGTKMNVP